MTTINIKICDKSGELVGEFLIGLCKRTKEKFQLDPETFYKKWNDGKLHAQNIEMMLKETTPFSIADMVTKAAHVHQGNDTNWYVCYTPQVKTMNEAIKLAVFWSVLTSFHMKYQADVGFFLSFHAWMNKQSASGKIFDGIDGFPLWIVANREWKVEFNIAGEMEKMDAKYYQQIFDLLKGEYFYLVHESDSYSKNVPRVGWPR